MRSLEYYINFIMDHSYKMYVMRKIQILYFIKFMKFYCKGIYEYNEVEMITLTLFENYFTIIILKDLYRYFLQY